MRRAWTTYWSFVFFFNDTATTEIYTLSLHDALPILPDRPHGKGRKDHPYVFRSVNGTDITDNVDYARPDACYRDTEDIFCKKANEVTVS